jgi:hypothetical protein
LTVRPPFRALAIGAVVIGALIVTATSDAAISPEAKHGLSAFGDLDRRAANR